MLCEGRVSIWQVELLFCGTKFTLPVGRALIVGLLEGPCLSQERVPQGVVQVGPQHPQEPLQAKEAVLTNIKVANKKNAPKNFSKTISILRKINRHKVNVAESFALLKAPSFY